MTAWSSGRKLAVGAALVAVLVLVSTSLVAAAPSLANAPRATDGPAPDGGSRAPTYSVTFTETGLPTGTNWSVDLAGPSAWSGSFLGSNTSTVTVELRNGSYHYSIPDASNVTTLFAPTPANGTVEVSGVAASVAIAFAAVPETSISFSESGLPSGTFWSVDLTGGAANGSGGWGPSPLCYGSSYSVGSTTPTVTFDVPSGSYQFAIGNVTNGSSEYVPVPSGGNVSANGTPLAIDVVFHAVALYNLSFAESGLPSIGPNGSYWSVVIWNASTGLQYNATSNASLSFEVPNGTYFFAVQNVSGNGTLYVPSPVDGNVTVAGANVQVPVAFTLVPLYNLSFVETGLPAGTPWYVILDNASVGWFYNATTNSSLSFLVPNGTYNYSVGTASWGPYPGHAAPLCANGTGNGTAGAVYVPTPSAGNVTVDGSNVQVPIVFAPLAYRSVTFTESGLPAGAFWQVHLVGGSSAGGGCGYGPTWGGSGWAGGTNASITLTVLEGTYGFYVPATFVNGTEYVATPTNGSLVVDGSNITINVVFTRLVLYNVSFEETGLPNGTFWSVVVYGPSIGTEYAGGRGSTISFELPNGTFGYTVLSPNSYPVAPFCANGSRAPPGEVVVATPSNGTVTVDGANVSVAIQFSYSALYAVTFTESGLPTGTFWYVIGPVLGYAGSPATSAAAPDWGVGPNGSTPSSVVFWLPNGTYQFTVPNATAPNGTVYAASPASFTVTVAGANVSISVAFSDPPAGGSHSGASAQGPATGGGMAPRAMLLELAAVGAAIIAAVGGALLLLRRRPAAPTRAAPTPGTGAHQP